VKYILKGSDYVRLIKRRKTDRVYWKDVLPHERVTEEDIKKHVLISFSTLKKVQDKFLTWQGCQRAELLAWNDEEGFPDWKYKPCHMKVSSAVFGPTEPKDFPILPSHNFCKRHLNYAEIDGWHR